MESYECLYQCVHTFLLEKENTSKLIGDMNKKIARYEQLSRCRLIDDLAFHNTKCWLFEEALEKKDLVFAKRKCFYKILNGLEQIRDIKKDEMTLLDEEERYRFISIKNQLKCELKLRIRWFSGVNFTKGLYPLDSDWDELVLLDENRVKEFVNNFSIHTKC